MEKADLEKAHQNYKEALKQYKQEQKELKRQEKAKQPKSNLSWLDKIELSLVTKVQKVVDKRIGWLNFKKDNPKEYEEAVLLEEIGSYLDTLLARCRRTECGKKNKPITIKHQAVLFQSVAPLSIIALTGSEINRSRAQSLLEVINGLMPKASE